MKINVVAMTSLIGAGAKNLEARTLETLQKCVFGVKDCSSAGSGAIRAGVQKGTQCPFLKKGLEMIYNTLK